MSLDETTIKNTMVTAAPVKKKFHFSGDGLYHNMTILAEDIEHATKAWLANRLLISPEQSTPGTEMSGESEVQ